jgi:hypothetical protein
MSLGLFGIDISPEMCEKFCGIGICEPIRNYKAGNTDFHQRGSLLAGRTLTNACVTLNIVAQVLILCQYFFSRKSRKSQISFKVLQYKSLGEQYKTSGERYPKSVE